MECDHLLSLVVSLLLLNIVCVCIHACVHMNGHVCLCVEATDEL